MIINILILKHKYVNNVLTDFYLHFKSNLKISVFYRKELIIFVVYSELFNFF